MNLIKYNFEKAHYIKNYKLVINIYEKYFLYY